MDEILGAWCTEYAEKLNEHLAMNGTVLLIALEVFTEIAEFYG
ncbi:MAG: hypothetical protein RMY36_009080 [Nostoc sp. SerVER01]|nr:hypothetical protein [Nostoc sp. SerVER01]